MKKLGDLLEFKNGINASKEQYGKGIKFVNVSDILNNDFLTYENIAGLVDIDSLTLSKYSVEYGDILFQRSSETRDEVGTANVYLDKDNTAAFGGFVIRGKKQGDYNPIFLNNLLKSATARNSITSRSGGSTRYNVGQEILSSVKLCFPTIAEQEKIGKLLSLIDNRIQTQNKIIKKLESLIRGIYSATKQESWIMYYLRDVLEQRDEQNIHEYPVFSVAVREGIINQIEHLGRSFAAKDTRNYNVVQFGDIVYTKSPTGSFPYDVFIRLIITE